jgi:hypothetical protein
VCTPKAQGGQRCVSSTTKALDSASKRLERMVGQYTHAVEAESSPPMRAELRARMLKAEHAFEDALVEHATTATGRAEVEALRDGAPLVLTDAENTRPKSFYDNVLISADYMRGVRERVKKQDGFVTRRDMDEIEYPGPGERSVRARQVEAVKARELKAARPPVNLPAGVTAERDERITDIYFSCENHNKPGQCTQECTDLEYAMAGDDGGVPYDPTGTTYGPPRPHTEYHYDEAQRASIAVTYTPV